MNVLNRKMFSNRDARKKLAGMGGILSSSPELMGTAQRFQEGGQGNAEQEFIVNIPGFSPPGEMLRITESTLAQLTKLVPELLSQKDTLVAPVEMLANVESRPGDAVVGTRLRRMFEAPAEQTSVSENLTLDSEAMANRAAAASMLGQQLSDLTFMPERTPGELEIVVEGEDQRAAEAATRRRIAEEDMAMAVPVPRDDFRTFPVAPDSDLTRAIEQRKRDEADEFFFNAGMFDRTAPENVARQPRGSSNLVGRDYTPTSSELSAQIADADLPDLRQSQTDTSYRDVLERFRGGSYPNIFDVRDERNIDLAQEQAQGAFNRRKAAGDFGKTILNFDSATAADIANETALRNREMASDNAGRLTAEELMSPDAPSATSVTSGRPRAQGIASFGVFDPIVDRFKEIRSEDAARNAAAAEGDLAGFLGVDSDNDETANRTADVNSVADDLNLEILGSNNGVYVVRDEKGQISELTAGDIFNAVEDLSRVPEKNPEYLKNLEAEYKTVIDRLADPDTSDNERTVLENRKLVLEERYDSNLLLSNLSYPTLQSRFERGVLDLAGNIGSKLGIVNPETAISFLDQADAVVVPEAPTIDLLEEVRAAEAGAGDAAVSQEPPTSLTAPEVTVDPGVDTSPAAPEVTVDPSVDTSSAAPEEDAAETDSSAPPKSLRPKLRPEEIIKKGSAAELADTVTENPDDPNGAAATAILDRAGVDTTGMDIKERTVAMRKVLSDLMGDTPEDEKNEFWMNMAMMGFAVAAGESPDALKNIADGLLAGTAQIQQGKAARKERGDKMTLTAFGEVLADQRATEKFGRDLAVAKVRAAGTDNKYNAARERSRLKEQIIKTPFDYPKLLDDSGTLDPTKLNEYLDLVVNAANETDEEIIVTEDQARAEFKKVVEQRPDLREAMLQRMKKQGFNTEGL